MVNIYQPHYFRPQNDASPQASSKLKTLLQVIFNCSSLLQKELTEEQIERQEYLKALSSATEDLLNILPDTLSSTLPDTLNSSNKSPVQSHSTSSKSHINMIVHDLRTPLSNILTGLQLIELEGKKEALGEFWPILKVSADHMLELIDNILDTAKAENDKLLLSKERFNIKEESQNLLKAISLRATLQNINLIFEDKIESQSSTIQADKSAFKRMVLNLLSNALKFTRSQISLTLNRSNNLFYLSVSDNGIGIDPKNIPLIFEEFGQTFEGRKHAHSTGLGLPMVRKYAKLHGGDLLLDSKPGEGACFTIILPT